MKHTLHNPNNGKKIYFSILPFLLLLLSFGLLGKTSAQVNLSFSSAQCFSALDNIAATDEDNIAGQITVHSLILNTGGSISANDPGSPCSYVGVPNASASPIKIIVLGNVELKNGSGIYTENRIQGGVGGSIVIEIRNGGSFIMRTGSVISSSNTVASTNGQAGDITISTAIGNISTEAGSTIKANSGKGKGGDISIVGGGSNSIAGMVLSQSGGTGTGTNQGHGGQISIKAHNSLLITDDGVVSSKGIDPGADLVHLCACSVTVYGLVESTGSGHGIPSNPPNHLANTNRPDKPSNSTAGVEIWASESLLIDNLNHHGQINADLCCSGGSNGTSYVDLFSQQTITILGGATDAAFAVHANGKAGNTDDGGIITVKSLLGFVSASGYALQADGTAFGGDISVEAFSNVNVNSAKLYARGDFAPTGGFGKGGNINIRSYHNNITWTSGTGDVRPTGTAANLPAADRGIITFGKCTAPVVDVTGSSFPNSGLPATTPVTSADNCVGAPQLPHGLNLPTYVEFCACDPQGGPICGCTFSCSGQTVTVNANVTIDFNAANAADYYTGDPALAPYFSYVKVGSDPAHWKAIFNLGNNKLLVKNGATISVTNVPNFSNNQGAPGIEIKTLCDLEIENGGHIVVNSLNQNAGDIDITVSGSITVNGEIRNEVSGTNGLPGAISITSTCGNLVVGQTGLIRDLGIDGGGKTINLSTCCGDITISGWVESYAHAHVQPFTLNRPNIQVAAFNGSVTINANSVEPLFDEFNQSGTKYDIYGGLLSWVRDNANPGKVLVQAQGNITVNGHGDDPTGPVRQSFGAIAAVATASDAPGGLVDIRSLGGKIIGNDRAFDVSGRNRLATNFAHINLLAKQNIELNKLGADQSFNPVVDASSPSIGDNGGLNTLRSFTGNIIIGNSALVSAVVPLGQGSVQGINQLVSCLGIQNNGMINPGDLDGTNDVGICIPTVIAPLFTNCNDLDALPPARSAPTAPIAAAAAVKVADKAVTGLEVFPNPFSTTTNIVYGLTKPSKVVVNVFNSQGKKVAEIVNAKQPAGNYKYQWNGANLPSGSYFIHLDTENTRNVSSVFLMK